MLGCPNGSDRALMAENNQFNPARPENQDTAFSGGLSVEPTGLGTASLTPVVFTTDSAGEIHPSAVSVPSGTSNPISISSSSSAPAPNLIGPLTITFTLPQSCSAFDNWGHRGLGCTAGSFAPGAGACWPPATSAGAGFVGWGYYSPGLVCPMDYATACSDSLRPTLGGPSLAPTGALTGISSFSFLVSAFGAWRDSDWMLPNGLQMHNAKPSDVLSRPSLNNVLDRRVQRGSAYEYGYVHYGYSQRDCTVRAVIQLNYRPSDLGITATESSPTTTNSDLPPVTSGSPPKSGHRLPTETKAVIATVIPVMFLALLAGLVAVVWRRRRHRHRRQQQEQPAFRTTMGDPHKAPGVAYGPEPFMGEPADTKIKPTIGEIADTSIGPPLGELADTRIEPATGELADTGMEAPEEERASQVDENSQVI